MQNRLTKKIKEWINEGKTPQERNMRSYLARNYEVIRK